MTKQDKAESLRAIEENPGWIREFECCAKHLTGDGCPPAIFCPNCGEVMFDKKAAIQEIIEWAEILKEETNGPSNPTFPRRAN
jgi:hypothetical protein